MMLTTLSFAACSDDTFDFGNTLTQQADKLEISATDYQVTTRSVMADSVLLRSSFCYLGRVKDPETGAYVTSEMMTQFNVLDTYTLTAEDKITSRYDGNMAGSRFLPNRTLYEYAYGHYRHAGSLKN